jgi:hypothetical protein
VTVAFNFISERTVYFVFVSLFFLFSFFSSFFPAVFSRSILYLSISLLTHLTNLSSSSSNYMEKILSSLRSWQRVSQEIIRLTWNPKVHYHVLKSRPLVPSLSQIFLRSILILSAYLRLGLLSEPSLQASQPIFFRISYLHHARYMFRSSPPAYRVIKKSLCSSLLININKLIPCSEEFKSI